MPPAPGISLFRPLHRMKQSPDDIAGIRAASHQKPTDFNEVDAAFARFDFRDPAMRDTEASAQFALGKSRAFARRF